MVENHYRMHFGETEIECDVIDRTLTFVSASRLKIEVNNGVNKTTNQTYRKWKQL